MLEKKNALKQSRERWTSYKITPDESSEQESFGVLRRKKYDRRTDEEYLLQLHPQVRELYQKGELDYADPQFLLTCKPIIDRVPHPDSDMDPMDQTQPPVGLSDEYVESGIGIRFLMGESLGSGAISDVHKGFDINTSRMVAIKKMKLDTFKSARDLEAYRNGMAIEAKSMARLKHKNLPRIDHMMVDDEGGLLYVMELFSKDEFQESRKFKGKIDSAQLARFVTELCDFEDYCNSLGVYHRDLKLGNVLMNVQTGSPIVLDMGISNWALKPQFENGFVNAGTPSHMSPERIIGDEREEQMFASEIYAIGIMLYTLITGENKHSIPEGLTYSEARKALVQIIVDQPDLSHENEEKIKKKCQELGLDGRIVIEVLNKALAGVPEDRYQSAEDLARDFLSAYSWE